MTYTFPLKKPYFRFVSFFFNEFLKSFELESEQLLLYRKLRKMDKKEQKFFSQERTCRMKQEKHQNSAF